MLHKMIDLKGLAPLDGVNGDCMTFHMRKKGKPLLLISTKYYFDYTKEGMPLENAVLEFGDRDKYPTRKVNNFFMDRTVIKEKEKKTPGQILSKPFKINILHIKYGKSAYHDDYIFTTLSAEEYRIKLLDWGIDYVDLIEESKMHTNNTVFEFGEV